MLLAADSVTERRPAIDSFWAALGRRARRRRRSASRSTSLFGTNDDDTYTLRVVQRIARRSGERTQTTRRASSSSRSTGSRCRCCSARCATATRPTMARWLADGSHRLVEWETDLSSQTGASQAGILLGSNDDIPAFRWVEKETGTLMTCSAPADCAEIERRHATGDGLLDRRRREPRQPALRRGRPRDPDGQPDGGREARQPRATARSSPTASTSRARSCCSSGRSILEWTARDRAPAPRRPPARPPRRHVSVPARRACASSCAT